MEFDIERFEQTQYKDRTDTVPVPKLKKLFKLKKNEKPEFVVRGLSGPEMASARDELQKGRRIEAICAAINSANPELITEAVKEISGISDNVSPDLVFRYSLVEQGSVNPKMTRPLVIKLAENHQEEFYAISEKINKLSGAGRLGE